MNLELIEKVDFGEIDGFGDPNLEKYFLDNGYWKKIVEGKVFFVAGKKGTGKSAIFSMIERESHQKGAIVVNRDFGEYPFEKLLKLDDDSFSKPNQYQTIWKNVIFNLFIQSIAKLPQEDNDYYREIVAYRDMFLGSAADVHREIVSKAVKTEGSIQIKNIGGSRSVEMNESLKMNADGSMTVLNSRLSELLVNYFVTTDSDSRIVIQFDRLDDNYNQYQNLEEYYQAIISLFKAAYNFNQLLRSKGVTNAKVVIYIRSDIMRAMASRDAESARWDDFRLDLSWIVSDMKHASDSDLYRMVLKRIHASGPEFRGKTLESVFGFDKRTLSECGINDLFTTLLNQTLMRPRDLIKLLKTLQEAIVKNGKLNAAIYKEARKKYAGWLVNTELANEINPVLKGDYEYVIELLRLCGSQVMSLKTFTERYSAVRHEFMFQPLELLKILYGAGIIQNAWKDDNTNGFYVRSAFRNEGDFDRNLTFRIVPVVWSGLKV